MRKEAGDFYIYVGGAMHTVDGSSGATHTMAWAAKNKCVVTMRTKDRKVVMCVGTARPHVIPPEHFEVDPLLQEAKLDHGDMHLSWVEERINDPDVSPSADSSGASLYTRVTSWAPARGRLLGINFGSQTSHFGLLTEGLFAGVLVNIPTSKVWLDDSNVIHYRIKVAQRRTAETAAQ